MLSGSRRQTTTSSSVERGHGSVPNTRISAWACAKLDTGMARPPANRLAAPAAISVSLVISSSSFQQLKRASRLVGSSYALRQFDCHPASGTDCRCQQRVADGIGCAGGTGAIAVLQLLGAELGDVGRKFGVLFTQLGELALIMFVDLRFDRVGAGQRCLLGHQGGCSPEGEAGDVPQRLERGRAH